MTRGRGPPREPPRKIRAAETAPPWRDTNNASLLDGGARTPVRWPLMRTSKTGLLVFEDGDVHRGTHFGFDGESCGELVFNTAMSGYQEIVTDPSYRGQIVLMTYPLIGNTGINEQDIESA